MSKGRGVRARRDEIGDCAGEDAPSTAGRMPALFFWLALNPICTLKRSWFSLV